MIIGAVSTRFAGLDGVSLEAAKVAEALGGLDHRTVWFAGALDSSFSPGVEYPPAHFDTEENRLIQASAFGWSPLLPDLRLRIDEAATDLGRALEAFLDQHAPDVLLIQNASAIPMQLPLGLAVADLTSRRRLTVIGHHHDFSWERERFDLCTVPDVLETAFPPVLDNYAHVVINQTAGEELLRRRGVTSAVLPNVMDFEAPAPAGHGAAYREAASLTGADIVLLQPTRVVPRKGIELTLELAHRLGDPAIKVVVSHADDLDPGYWEELQRLAEDLDVDLRLAPAENLANAYAAADLVCLPSRYEGFGNALVEAFFYRRPVFVNRYPVYRRDIAPTGVVCIETDEVLSDDVVAQAHAWLAGSSDMSAALERNQEIGLEHFSFRTVREVLRPLLGSP